MSDHQSVFPQAGVLIDEQERHILTVEEIIPLALAIAYLAPPKQAKLKHSPNHKTGNTDYVITQEGWGRARGPDEARTRLNEAALAMGELERILTTPRVGRLPGLAPQHRNHFKYDSQEVVAFGHAFPRTNGLIPDFIYTQTFDRRGSDVVVRTDYFAKIRQPSSDQA